MLRLLLAIFLQLGLQNLAVSDENLWEVVKESSVASIQTNYSGIISTTDENKNIQSTRVIHVNLKGEEFLKIEKIDGAPNLLLMHQTDAVIYDNDKDKILIQKKQNAKLFPNIFPSNLNRLKENYDILSGGKIRVADRLTQLLVFTPKDEYRYFYHLWIDDETSLPLKMVITDNNKKTIENIAFGNIEFLSNEDISWFRPKFDPSKKYSINENKAVVEQGKKVWSISEAPPGFEEVSYQTKRYVGLNTFAHQFIYSDGLSFISIFIHPVPKKQKPQVGISRRGSSNIVAEYKKGYQILAVGSVPADTLQSFADKVDLNQ